MSQQKHTPGPYSYGGDNDGWYLESLSAKEKLGHGGQIAYCPSENDARRISTCLNACIDLSDDALEGGWTAKGMISYAKSLEQQIDAHQSAASGEGSDSAEGNAAALDGLQEQYDAASRHLDEVQDNYDALLDAQAQAEDEEADARQTVADLTRDEAEAAQDADSASQDAAEAEGYLTEAEGNLQQVRTDRLLAEKEQRTA